MTSHIYRRIVWFFLVCAITPSLFGQTNKIENLFNEGLILYKNNSIEQAHDNFVKLAAISNDNSRLTAAILMSAKTSFALQNYSETIECAGRLIDEYPQSSYKAYAFYLRAGAEYEKRSYASAIEDLAYAIEFAGNQELLRTAESAGTNLVAGYIRKSTIDNVYNAYAWKQALPMLSIWRAHLTAKSGRQANAKEMLNAFIATNPDNRYKIIAKKLAENVLPDEHETFRIGIIQPVSGYFADESHDFLKGLAFALAKHRPQSPEIQLLLKDTKGSIVESINAAWELVDENVDLVITGLEGQKSAAIAGIFQQAKIPVIIPVATDNNLTQLGDYVFQMNTDMETRGAGLAAYAMKDLQMKTFATLAPADDYGNALTDAFTNMIDSLGGTIVSQQWYYTGTTDFSRQLESLREAAFRYAYRDSLRAWGMNVNMARIDSLYSRLDRSTRRESDDNEGLVKFTDIAVRSIDGIFLPIYEEDIPYVASQFAVYNIKARLLGGDNWSNADVLRTQQRYVNGVVFFAGHFLSESDLDYINFTRDFRIASSSSPGTMAIYGYNIMNLIISGLTQGNATAQKLAAYLKNVHNFKGLGTNISFQNGKRVNSAVNILQFQDGNILRINPAN